jgi:hypothetical protein
VCSTKVAACWVPTPHCLLPSVQCPDKTGVVVQYAHDSHRRASARGVVRRFRGCPVSHAIAMRLALRGAKWALGGALIASVVGGAYVAVDERRRRQAHRMGMFWSRALPKLMVSFEKTWRSRPSVLLQLITPTSQVYRWEEFRVRNLPEAEQKEAFRRLHCRYAPESLADILHMRGLYIKLGQMMTTRADYAPPEVLQLGSVLLVSDPLFAVWVPAVALVASS